jgi:ligand-binding SRPBCC domain-containing protein
MANHYSAGGSLPHFPHPRCNIQAGAMSLKLQFEQWVPYSLERVFRFFGNPNNLPKIMPPRTATRIDSLRLIHPSGEPDLADVGSEIVTSFKVLSFLPFRSTWVARITEFEWNDHFADTQKLGPFKSFHHRHQLKQESRNSISGTIVRDVIDLEVGFGWLGWLIERLFIRGQMKVTFRYRQQALEKLLEINPT